MTDLSPFVEQLFVDLPDTPAAQRLRQNILAQLDADLRQQLASGLEPAAAEKQALFNFGAELALQAALADLRLEQEYRRFQRRRPKLLRAGMIGCIVLLPLFLVLMFSVDSRLLALTGWIISLIGLATFMICVEYTAYRYEKLRDPNERRLARLSAKMQRWLSKSLTSED